MAVALWVNGIIEAIRICVFFMEKPQKTLQEILTEADRVNPNTQGSSTAVMASLTPGT